MQESWNMAASHAAWELRAFGQWRCLCRHCVPARTPLGSIQCGVCGSPAKAVYCSGACRQAAYRRLHPSD